MAIKPVKVNDFIGLDKEAPKTVSKIVNEAREKEEKTKLVKQR